MTAATHELLRGPDVAVRECIMGRRPRTTQGVAGAAGRESLAQARAAAAGAGEPGVDGDPLALDAKAVECVADGVVSSAVRVGPVLVPSHFSSKAPAATPEETASSANLARIGNTCWTRSIRART